MLFSIEIALIIVNSHSRQGNGRIKRDSQRVTNVFAGRLNKEANKEFSDDSASERVENIIEAWLDKHVTIFILL